ncbi:N-acetylglucosaminyl transferase component-domain-containing protein [Zalerion maritima]|uniref:N-acetylglucosaminyl transferase component-domain-containing protein n=1 Tax=Zalerion maritima TaxID=339359 RepID=A0AAD5RMP7_9PEZI|nr:N-acetylglucosaminyl transferase component-domain-containing protein [Zalerion maritima]
MHPFSILTLGIFVAGYITARWDLVTRLYELTIFAWDYGVVYRAACAIGILTASFLLVFIPVYWVASLEEQVSVFGMWLLTDFGFLLAINSTPGLLAPDMPDHDGLMRIFWPADIPRSDLPGVIVGWRNSALDVFVVTVLDCVDPLNVENALKVGTLLRGAPHTTSRITELCAPQGQSTMHVLGVTNGPEPSGVDPSWVRATTGPSLKVPRIRCAKASSVQIILFERPNPVKMQYFSLNPMALALEEKNINVVVPPGSIEAEDEKEERRKRELKQKMVEKLKQHSIADHTPSSKEKALARVVNQINWSWEIEKLVQKNVSLIGTRPRRTLSVSERVVESANTMKNFVLLSLWHVIILYAWPVVKRIFVMLLLLHRTIAELLLIVLEWRAQPHHAALKDISATAQQVEIRLQQFCYWPIQYVKLRLRKNDWDSVNTSHPDYIRFYNSLWLVANDVIIGIALGSYIIENSNWVAYQINNLLGKYSVEALQISITWLMGWPAGLKLNSELGAFLGDLFLWVIDYWGSCVEILKPSLPHIVWFIGFTSFAGASMPVAMFSDLVSLLTLHIYSFYLASARIFHWQLSILISLFHLFRGKKHNVLRNRIDSCDYDLDQLLVGTMLFTLLVFLLPTVVVYYLNFAVARMAIITLKAGFDSLLSCLNHFPLFALMLRLKDPRRLPGGVRFELRDTQNNRPAINSAFNEPPTSVIHVMISACTACSSHVRSNVSPIPPNVATATQTLRLATGSHVPGDREVCAADQPQDIVQPPVQHVAKTPGWDNGDVGHDKLIVQAQEAAPSAPVYFTWAAYQWEA